MRRAETALGRPVATASFDGVDYEIRPITDDEVPAFGAALNLGFGGDPNPSGEEGFRATMPLERTLAAFDGDQVVATFGDFPLKLSVPGGASISMAGTTMVTVRATHRRRGILRALMLRNLTDVGERGDPVAGLWASEAAIYGRFGYGQACESHEIKLDARLTALPASPKSIVVEMIPTEQLVADVMPFWSSVAPARSGFVDRSQARWADIAADRESRRGGASMLRCVVARRDGEVQGFLSYRQVREWTDGVPEGSVQIHDLVSADIDASRALWHFVTHIDLFPKVSFWNAPVDDLLTLDAADPRQVHRSVIDTLYVRVLDVRAALEARTYEIDGAVTLEVADDLGFASGTFRLDVADGVARVSRTEAAAEVALDVRELGALYLGMGGAGRLAAAGRISGEAAAVTLLDRLFRTAAAPWCPEMF